MHPTYGGSNLFSLEKRAVRTYVLAGRMYVRMYVHPTHSQTKATSTMTMIDDGTENLHSTKNSYM